MAITDPTYHAGTDGNPDNDVDPVGGDIDDGSELDEDTPNTLIYKPKISDVENTYRGVAYRLGQAGTNWQAGKLTNRAGCNPPSSSGFARLVSTSAADTGKAWLAYKHGDEWQTEEIQMAGLTPVTGLVSLDEDTDLVLIYEPGIPAGDIHLSVNDEKLAVNYGGAKGNIGVSTLCEIAVATAQDAAISCDDRLHDPGSGVGSFSRATWWIGQDNRLAIPGDDLEEDHYFGYCVRARFPAGMPKPYGGYLPFDADLMGDPIEV